jgi:hypothetical protein
LHRKLERYASNDSSPEAEEHATSNGVSS